MSFGQIVYTVTISVVVPTIVTILTLILAPYFSSKFEERKYGAQRIAEEKMNLYPQPVELTAKSELIAKEFIVARQRQESLEEHQRNLRSIIKDVSVKRARLEVFSYEATPIRVLNKILSLLDSISKRSRFELSGTNIIEDNNLLDDLSEKIKVLNALLRKDLGRKDLPQIASNEVIHRNTSEI